MSEKGFNSQNVEANFIRHAKSTYATKAKNLSEDPQSRIDVENQVTPDLSMKGVEQAQEKATEFFKELNPENDILFFVSSSEARALETARIYLDEAHKQRFEIIQPEHVRGELVDSIGDGQVRVIKTLSLNIKNTLLDALFDPTKTLDRINMEALDSETRNRWEAARQIITENGDTENWGTNFIRYSDEIQKIFPEIKTSKELFESRFKRLLQLYKFATEKFRNFGSDKNLKVLAFGHKETVGYALQEYFGDHNINNCEAITLETPNDDSEALQLKRRNDTATLK